MLPMHDVMQIGAVRFVFNIPFSYPWSKKDERFRVKEPQTYSRLVHVNILFSESLEEPQERPLYEEEGIKVWKQSETNIRSFRAMFLQGYPLYAISRWTADDVDIQFDNSTHVWSHPNMMLWALVHLENQLLLADSLILHSCYIQHQGKAILFSAPSGTGKTTQAKLWERLYGSDIVNGDLALLQQTNTGWWACGYPISGSAEECENKSYPIQAIAIVRQSPDNYIEELSLAQKIQWLYSESFINQWDGCQVNKMLNLLTDLSSKVPVVMLHCNMEDEAAHGLHEYLNK